MSFFLFAGDDADVPADVLLRPDSLFAPFAPRRLRTAAGKAYVFGSLSGGAPDLYERDDGDFAVALGALVYHDEIGTPGLARLWHDFDPGDFAWAGLLGIHTVLVRKHGTLHVFGDGLGASRIYHDADRSVWSSSFLAICEIARPRRLDLQACCEFVTSGAVYGERTLVEGVRALPANAILSIDRRGRADVTRHPSPISDAPPADARSLDTIADELVRRLDDVFRPIATHFGDRVRLSFSGGFDSRLMLAMLLRHGARPTLFVYGTDADADVRIARLISRAEGLSLDCIDKGRVAPPAPDAFAEEVERNLVAFDGWKVEVPLFDFGEDRRDRLARHADGQVPLNGSLGEIYRNFFYMPDRPSSTGAVVSTFYSRYDPRMFTDRFDERRFRTQIGDAMGSAIGAGAGPLRRWQVEQVYPRFRGRFWTGRDAQVNQRFGPMFFPYLEHAAISGTARVPIRFKDLGLLQGRMIGRVDPRLAGYPSDYGFALDGPRPLAYRAKTLAGTWRPPALRKLSFRLTHRQREPRDGPLSDRYLGRVIDLGFPVMRGLFELDAVHSATQYGLVATLEYLAQRFGLELPPE